MHSPVAGLSLAVLMSAWARPCRGLDTAPRAPASTTDSVMVNLSSLLVRHGELRWEHRVSAGHSVGLLGGAGLWNDGDGGADQWLGALGAHWRWYALGTIDHGLAITAEIAGQALMADALDRRGLAVSPRLAYKRSWSPGLTAEAQVGASWVLRLARKVNGNTWDNNQYMQANFALCLGWSF